MKAVEEGRRYGKGWSRGTPEKHQAAPNSVAKSVLGKQRKKKEQSKAALYKYPYKFAKSLFVKEKREDPKNTCKETGGASEKHLFRQSEADAC